MKAITTINTVLTIPASTAACPKISAPTIPMVFPMVPGTRIADSRKSSKANSIKRISATVEKGTDSREAVTESSSSTGRVSV